MPTFTTAIQTRTFTETMAPPAVRLTPERFSRTDRGGPRTAKFQAKGGIPALWELTQALRSPVNVYDDRGRWVWGGYIAEVRIPLGLLDAIATLDTMSNKVRMVYTTRRVGEAAAEQKTTAWAENVDSIDIYGEKALQLSASRLNDDEAEARRDTELNERAFPIGEFVQGNNGFGLGGTAERVATVICKGWWDTLDWTYFEETTGLESYSDTDSDTAGVVKVGQDPFTSAYVRFDGGKVIVGSERHLTESNHVLMLGQAPYVSSGIAFEDADQDRIFKVTGGFTAFVPHMTMTVSGAAEAANNGVKYVTDVLEETHLVIDTDLDPESAGNTITLTPRGYSKISQSFSIAAGTITAIRVRMQRSGTTADNAVLKVYADVSGSAGGAALATVSLTGSEIGTGQDDVEFGMSLSGLTTGTTYWFELTRSGSDSTTDAYAVAIDTSAGYSRGQCKVWNGSAWVVPPVACDLNFEIIYDPTTDLRGFVAGEQIEVSGATNGGNNGVKRITSADPKELTLEEDTTDEESGASVTIAPQSKFVRQTFELGDVTTFDTQEIRLVAGISGSPTDDLVVNLRRNDVGATLLATGSIPASELGEDVTEVAITLDTRVTLTNPDPDGYLIGVTRSGAASVMDAYVVRINEAAGYPRGEVLLATSTTYTARTPAADMNFVVVGIRNVLTQAQTMLMAGNQFLSDVDLNATSTLYSSPLRDGKSTVLTEIEPLLFDGNGGRVIVEVDEERVAHFRNESTDPLEELFLLSDGSLETAAGTRIDKWLAPAGVWVKYKELTSVASEAGLLADASRFFVHGWDYDVTNDRLTPTAIRGARSTWQIGGVQQG